jgi:hypothetical protein
LRLAGVRRQDDPDRKAIGQAVQRRHELGHFGSRVFVARVQHGRVVERQKPQRFYPRQLIFQLGKHMQHRFGIFGKDTRSPAGEGRFAEERHAAGRHDCSGLLQQQRLAGAALAGQQRHHALRCKILDREDDVRRIAAFPARHVRLVDSRHRVPRLSISTARPRLPPLIARVLGGGFGLAADKAVPAHRAAPRCPDGRQPASSASLTSLPMPVREGGERR